MHVCVAVFSRKPEDVEKLMVRYDDRGDTETYYHFEPLEESDEELQAEFEEEKEASKVPPTYEQYAEGDARDPAVIRAEYEEFLADYKPIETFDEFMRANYACCYNEESGKYGAYYKSTQRVDYWTEDAEWRRLLRLKSGEEVSRAQLKDISTEPQGDNALILKRIWEIFIEGQPLVEGEDRQYFESLIDEKGMFSMCPNEKWFDREDVLKLYGSKENFILAHTLLFPWGVLLPDGEWHETRMFGLVPMYFELFPQELKDKIDASFDGPQEGIFLDTQSKVLTLFGEMLTSDPELWLTLLDCHI